MGPLRLSVASSLCIFLSKREEADRRLEVRRQLLTCGRDRKGNTRQHCLPWVPSSLGIEFTREEDRTQDTNLNSQRIDWWLRLYLLPLILENKMEEEKSQTWLPPLYSFLSFYFKVKGKGIWQPGGDKGQETNNQASSAQ
jgi:hypothetical protein